ncbi:MAG TPA: Hsp20/alpha crystallin family protein [Candidatus Paceibacterota bacterium]|nr:Hsp20/alpha crystallin family protein [Candidatus Paceibacterota bacterium]
MFTKKISVAENSNYSGETEEGELTVDVYADGNNIVIESLIAGLNPDELDISIAHDLVTIKGERKRSQEISSKNYYYQECFYGDFSRTILLPTDIDPDKAKANFSKNGVLTIVMPKVEQKLTSKRLAIEEEKEDEPVAETKPRHRVKEVEEETGKEEEVTEEPENEEEAETAPQENENVSEAEGSSEKDWALLSPRPVIKRKTRTPKSQGEE